MLDDTALLRRYSEENSEAAFAELVHRRLDLVYSVALRATRGDAHRAHDTAQQVFTVLARKAALLAQRPTLTGWLHRSSQLVAADLMRAERRRVAREIAFHAMNVPADDHAPNWDEIRPVIDETLAELNDRDRDALLLRFFETLSFADIAGRLRLTEDAARMRVERALAKMRTRLGRRGVISTTAALTGAVATQAGFASPLGAAASITSAALSAAVSSSSGAVLLAIFTMGKVKTGIAGTFAIAVLFTAVIEARTSRELTAKLHSLQTGSENLARLQMENQQLNVSLRQQSEKNPEADAVARLHERVAQLQARPDGVTDSGMKPLINAGRATPEAALTTFYWAISAGNLDTMASFIVFDDDSKASREAFMAAFSGVVRDRYRTPERLCAATFFPQAGEKSDPAVAAQILSVEEDHGADRLHTRVWYRTASGREAEAKDRFQRMPDGWVLAGNVAFSRADLRPLVLSRIDQTTGDSIPPKK